ncbi:dehydrogenase E1 component subunit alpha/beta [Cyclobacteriaceae bacterium]|nr:dehydrogenase E1 component subunit alpha/beta [Cyclobacteriaceae bacterium]
MKFNKKSFSNKQLINIYKNLLKPRLVEEKMLLLLRKGEISKWFSGIGQEAISVGATLALRDEEYLLPVHRNLGVFTARKVPLDKIFAQFQGRSAGYTKGRDRSFHFGTQEHRIIGMISHLASQLSVADGIALGQRLNNENYLTVAFTGDGGTSEGEFHEALNVAAVWNLPVLFIVENNGYSLSTPTNEQFRFKSFTEKGKAYGIEAQKINGNNVLEVYEAVYRASRNMRRHPKPMIIEAETFRMRGHEEASGTDYVPEELFAKWEKLDPVENFEKYLFREKILTRAAADKIHAVLKKEIEKAWIKNEMYDYPKASEQELEDVYAPHSPSIAIPDYHTTSPKRYLDAIRDTLDDNMKKDDDLVLMGQDIAEYGGVFKATEGLVQKYGKDRVRNTPLCESAITGIGLGLSIVNKKSVIEMQFADFVSCAFNQIVNNWAKTHYRWGQAVNVVLRMPSGAGSQAGPFHSQSTEAWFYNTPGLKIVYPSSAIDAKGLLNAAIEDPNPVIYFEHKLLYRSLTEEVPDNDYTFAIGKAKVVTQGSDLTIVTYGMGVHWVNNYIENHPEHSIELVDLRSLQPWDKETVKEAVEKTGKAIVLTEDTLTGSIASDIASWINENLFESLDAPVQRVGSLDTPIPFHKNLEEEFLPQKRLSETISKLLEY